MVFIPFVSTFEKRKGGGGGKSSTCTRFGIAALTARVLTPFL